MQRGKKMQKSRFTKSYPKRKVGIKKNTKIKQLHMTENNKSKYECLFNIKFSRFFFLQIGIDHRAIKKTWTTQISS